MFSQEKKILPCLYFEEKKLMQTKGTFKRLLSYSENISLIQNPCFIPTETSTVGTVSNVNYAMMHAFSVKQQRQLE